MLKLVGHIKTAGGNARWTCTSASPFTGQLEAGLSSRSRTHSATLFICVAHLSLTAGRRRIPSARYSLTLPIALEGRLISCAVAFACWPSHQGHDLQPYTAALALDHPVLFVNWTID